MRKAIIIAFILLPTMAMADDNTMELQRIADELYQQRQELEDQESQRQADHDEMINAIRQQNDDIYFDRLMRPLPRY